LFFENDKWHFSTGMGGNFQPEQVAGFTGMGGRFGPEYTIEKRIQSINGLEKQ